MAGGVAVAWISLGSAANYIQQTLNALMVRIGERPDQELVFAGIIAGVGCYEGFRVEGGAEGSPADDASVWSRSSDHRGRSVLHADLLRAGVSRRGRDRTMPSTMDAVIDVAGVGDAVRHARSGRGEPSRSHGADHGDPGGSGCGKSTLLPISSACRGRTRPDLGEGQDITPLDGEQLVDSGAHGHPLPKRALFNSMTVVRCRLPCGAHAAGRLHDPDHDRSSSNWWVCPASRTSSGAAFGGDEEAAAWPGHRHGSGDPLLRRASAA